MKGGLSMAKQPHVVVVGAGAFGGWTALYLRRGGARVTLVDAWGPGNARASSGGETRVIRATYGPRAVYTHMAVRALALWREHERRWKQRLLHPIGVLWLVEDDDSYEKAALPLLKEAGCRFEELSGAETAKRYPQINCARVRWAIACERRVRKCASSAHRPVTRASPRRRSPCGPTTPITSCTGSRGTNGVGSRWRTTRGDRRSTPPPASVCRRRRRYAAPATTWHSAFRRSRTLRWSKRACASTRTRRTSTSSSIATRPRRMPGSWAAARDTGSSTARRWASWLPDWCSWSSRRSSRKMKRARRRWPPGRSTRPGCG